MDFTKVKAMLIAVFLGLNLFLVYQWRVLQTNVSVYAEPFSDQLANVQSALAERRARINTVLPNADPQLPMVRVDYDRPALSRVAATVLALKPIQAKKWLRDSNHVISPLVDISYTSPGHLDVAYHPPFISSTHDRHRQPASYSEWLIRQVFNGNEYQFFGWGAKGTQRVAVFLQQVNGYPVFGAPLRFLIGGKRLIRYDQTMLAVRGTHGASRQVISAVNALLSVAQYLQKVRSSDENKISDVRLGYYSDIVTNEGWYLTPVWRVNTNRGVFFVNAFTGDVEVAPS